jgi:hypothetical protein
MSETAYPERYTLEMAARVISEQTGEKDKDIQSLLIAAVQEGKLPVCKPGSDVYYKPSTVREFYEEAFWDDLNIWMDEFLPRIKWRFPSDEKEEMGQITLAAAAGAEPDYQEYLSLDEIILLAHAICYALGIPPNPEDRNAFSDNRESDYAELLNRAQSAIHSDKLNADKIDGEYWISKEAFRLWIEHQGIPLNKRYMEVAPMNSKPHSPVKKRANAIVKAAKELFEDPMKIPDGGKSELRELLCRKQKNLFTQSTFDAAWKYLRKKNFVQMENHKDYITSK